MRELKELSVIVPGLNEAENLPYLYAELMRALGQMDWNLQILFVDDGSTDNTLEVCRDLHAKNPNFNYISLSRNFGHQRALTAGLDLVSGDAVVVMDADLQDPPAVVLKMIELWRQGVDVAYGRRRTREGESFFKKATAALFYKVIRHLSGTPIPENTGDFRLMDIRVVREVRKLREQGRFMRGLVAWVGFRQEAVYYDRLSRLAGSTKYPLLRMLRFAWDGITSFSIMPLRLATLTGFLCAMLAFILALYYTIRIYFFDGFVKTGAGIVVTMLFLGGLQIFFIGVVGEYIAKCFFQVIDRPLYIVRESSRPFDKLT